MAKPKGIAWAIGAGFSKPLGAPLLRDLLRSDSANRVNAVYGKLPLPIDPGRQIPKIFEKGRARRTERDNAEEFLERLDLAAQRDKESSRDLFCVSCRDCGIEIAPDKPNDLRFQGLRLPGAEICLFTKDLDSEMERMAPYVAWAKTLEPEDTIISFNYDRVIELVRSIPSKGIFVPTPPESIEPMQGTPRVFKLHGSVDWIRVGQNVRRSDDPDAVLQCSSADEIALATPGPTKQRLVQRGGAFHELWESAAKALETAEAIVLVGYRIPPTESYTKQWLIDRLRSRLDRSNLVNPSNTIPKIPLHTVLGPNLGKPDAVRIAGLLKKIHAGIDHHPWDMGTEDFLGLATREQLLHPSRQ